MPEKASIPTAAMAFSLAGQSKVCNLVNRAAAARYDVLVIADSDIDALADYLSDVVNILEKPGVSAVTRLYHRWREIRYGAASRIWPLFWASLERHLAERNMIDVPKDTRCEVGELVEGRPYRQLAVQAATVSNLPMS